MMPKLSFVILLMSLFGVAKAQHHDMSMSMSMPTSTNVYLKMMDQMMVNMDRVVPTASADEDFLAMMIPHHQGAVDMANYEIAHGKNRELIQLAKSIKAEQLVQIQQMQLLLRNTKTFAGKGKAHQQANQKMMVVMMQQMPKDKTLSNDDNAFARVMIPHHQAAIDMAKVALQYGTDKNTKRLAESIISDEQIEIDQMKKFTPIQ
ncbi:MULTISPECIES: DUF305 domain-containing protein [Mucilaginibacter]|jgi:uncharacterized protein (DUF305 family)|uniref:DUF305 domain-containing protein n=1 Tax=Mucilaginibacter agri TaxID=2695265 RepID=A0A965ZDI1_9SPHI|nr:MULTISPECIES: DUF305 domain-containing protein [Mucilaginibacter]NCD67786.1 DUF305 domain-containing protein [Mucilaginibacter agri]NHA05782.1 DUF305 domain-containing protein [Mucilaginibacter inviolabilis]